MGRYPTIVDDLERLLGMGLSHRASRVALALLSLSLRGGSRTVEVDRPTLSSLSGVARNKTYDATKELAEAGFVVVVGDSQYTLYHQSQIGTTTSPKTGLATSPKSGLQVVPNRDYPPSPETGLQVEPQAAEESTPPATPSRKRHSRAILAQEGDKGGVLFGGTTPNDSYSEEPILQTEEKEKPKATRSTESERALAKKLADMWLSVHHPARFPAKPSWVAFLGWVRSEAARMGEEDLVVWWERFLAHHDERFQKWNGHEWWKFEEWLVQNRTKWMNDVPPAPYWNAPEPAPKGAWSLEILRMREDLASGYRWLRSEMGEGRAVFIDGQGFVGVGQLNKAKVSKALAYLASLKDDIERKADAEIQASVV